MVVFLGSAGTEGTSAVPAGSLRTAEKLEGGVDLDDDDNALGLDGVAMKLGFRIAVGVFARALALAVPDPALSASLLVLLPVPIFPPGKYTPNSSTEDDAVPIVEAAAVAVYGSSHGVGGNGKLVLLEEVIPLTGLGDIDRWPAKLKLACRLSLSCDLSRRFSLPEVSVDEVLGVLSLLYELGAVRSMNADEDIDLVSDGRGGLPVSAEAFEDDLFDSVPAVDGGSELRPENDLYAAELLALEEARDMAEVDLARLSREDTPAMPLLCWEVGRRDARLLLRDIASFESWLVSAEGASSSSLKRQK